MTPPSKPPSGGRPVPSYVALCTLSALGHERPTLVRGPGGRRLVCVRRGDSVDVLDDECPHEGHPLSMGLVRDNVLTCPWHNWRFDTGSGQCLVGEESVRRHRTEVLHGELFVAIDQDEHELERHTTDFVRALQAASIDGAVRSALRVARGASPFAAFAVALRFAAGRARTGPGELCSIARAAWDLYERTVLSLPESLAVLSVAAIDAALTVNRATEPAPTRSAEHDVSEVLLALAEERVDDVVSRALGLDPEADVAAVGRAWLAPWLATKLWNAGALISWVDDALALAQLAQREGDGSLARSLLAATLRSAAFAVAESDLPGWRTTRQALLDQRSIRGNGQGPVLDPDALLAELLGSEAQAIAAARRELDGGVSIAALQACLARAAVERLARYDVRWSRRATVRPECAIDLGISTRMTRTLVESPAKSRASVAHSLMAAGLIGKQRRTTSDAPVSSLEDSASSVDALRALVRRGCLSAATARAEGAPLAAALWSLASNGVVEPSRCAAAARRAFVDDAVTDLERVAQVAALRVARDGSVKSRPASIP
jgi:nitrite reductase/ring-hydroxylating ferredoxin subunit